MHAIDVGVEARSPFFEALVKLHAIYLSRGAN